ncbi:radical SAM protein [Micromonospora taraxaci]|uniref:Radical SAM protein with 4Fe4S-binding SPASM domain n=1 Tax=Micromonospora taraxaci TaxID=1316803 RepID=A0A561W4V2_9ACTN|nr:radical SAM protein [Micromonospora taraxaci]TWG18899.1 radical SAM protein with 4Fe4S-binding SPASM domain [Micromonospora taraxaci]
MTDREPGSHSLENLTISLTLACNQACQHCWVDAGKAQPGELDDDEIRSVLTQARGLGARHVKFTGGEPLLRPGFVDLMRCAYDQGFRISLETNGTVLSEATLGELTRIGDRLHLYVSLDGASAATHDSFRGQRGAFTRTVDNLRRLCDNDLYFSIHTVVRRGNLHEIHDILDLAGDLGASQLKLILSVHELGRGHGLAKDVIGADELFDLLARLPPQRLWDYAWDPHRSRTPVLMTTLPPAFQPGGATTTCGWSKSFLAVLANGEVAICQGMYEFDQAKAGNVRDRSLADIWQESPLFTSTRAWQVDDLHGVCGNCAVAESCRGLCRASAIARYRDLRAPYPLCQVLYDGGHFPATMLRDAARPTPYADAEPAAEGGPGRRLLPLTALSSTGPGGR